MIIREYYEEMTKKQKIKGIVCDVCKKEYDPDNFIEMQEFHFVNFTGGYGSVFGDSSTVRCDICQNCLHTLIGDYVRIDEEEEE